MKLRLPWSRKPSTAGSELADSKIGEEQIEIDIKTPREAVYGSFQDRPGPCPKCGGELFQSRQTYMVSTRTGRQLADSFMIGSDFGWFCRSCPVVVINVERVGEMLGFGKPGWNIGKELVVLGIIDLDAVPESKRELTLDELGDQLPLVEFSNLLRARVSGRRSKAKRHKKRRK